MNSKKIFISAGELSGDIHGGDLIHSLTNKQTDIDITAIGGDNMQEAGADLLYHIEETSFMGLVEVVKHLPKIYSIWRTTKKHIQKIQPDLIILIDYPGFNLRLAKFANKHNIPVVYYISPKIWAWKEYRVKTIRKSVDKVISILPFEVEWYRERGVEVEYVGNPLVEQFEPVKEPKKSNFIHNPQIGLFPGSRNQEVDSLLPTMIKGVQKLKSKYSGLEARIAMAPGVDFKQYRSEYPFPWLEWEQGNNTEIMRESDFLIMCSGTATLEATVLNTPMVVLYKVSPLTYLLGRWLIKVSFISLTNLIADKEIVPELIQYRADSDHIYSVVKDYFQNPDKINQMRKDLAQVTRMLGEEGVSKRAGEVVLKTIKQYDQN